MMLVDLRMFLGMGLAAGLFFSTAAGSQGILPSHGTYQAPQATDVPVMTSLPIEGDAMIDPVARKALDALAYAGVEDYEPRLGIRADARQFAANIAWLKGHLAKNVEGHWVWSSTLAGDAAQTEPAVPQSSAFAQAVGIQALLADWRQTNSADSLAVAVKAAQVLFAPLDKGGFVFSSGPDIWFEQTSSAIVNPDHSLNGHLRVLLALEELKDATGDPRYDQWLAKGRETLLRWLPLFDTGYWLRTDLQPRHQELLFRLANPYGFASPELAIDRIVLRDPVSGKASVLDIGSAKDTQGALRIDGAGWGAAQTLDKRTVRRLRPMPGERGHDEVAGQMPAAHSYFYLALPGEWSDNLRRQRLELIVEYLDEQPGNLEVQQRSIVPGSKYFRSLADGELLLSGSGSWRQWKIPLKPGDLGNKADLLLGQKFARYLAMLAVDDPRFEAWSDLSQGYVNSQSTAAAEQVRPGRQPLPEQTPVLPFYSVDDKGVLLMHLGPVSPAHPEGTAVYSLFVVASQAMTGAQMKNRATVLEPSRAGSSGIQKGPAINWLLDPSNQTAVKDATVYRFGFRNVYNDVVTNPPWQSSFGQTYVMKALLQIHKDKLAAQAKVSETLERTLKAYALDVRDGGLAHPDRQGGLFFEEVPNATHVLNAQLSALPVIHEVARELDDASGQTSWNKGLAALREHLARFDTGYWLRYDLNPKKELLFQFDWLSGDSGALIESIHLQAPQFAKAVRLAVGSDTAFEGDTRISGPQWSALQRVDGQWVRSFTNGYRVNEQAVPGGTRQNAYAQLQLPVTRFSDLFDVLPHRLVIRYKDVAAGRFVVKIQSINEGKSLAFVPLRDAVVNLSGDQRWKTATIEVRPQDMGWYKGPEYQSYEVEQIEKIAALTQDWFFKQYAQRQRYYLKARAENRPVIIQPLPEGAFDSSLTVVDSSATYPGFGFANALDGDASNNYVASKEDIASGHVTLRLGEPATAGLLTLQWESASNYPRQVRVLAVDAGSGVTRELAVHSPVSGEDTVIRLQATQAFGILRLEFSQFAGQPRLLMRLIDFKARSSQSDRVAIAGNYLSATDARNPLSLFRFAVSQRIRSLSDELVQGISDEHQQVVAFMNFMDGLAVGTASAGTPEATIDEGKGACGSFTNTLLALAAAQGLEGRYVNLHNYPVGDGHTLAEIRIKDKWALYDPTYGAYYTRAGSSVPLSFDEVRAGYAAGQDVQVHHNSRRDGVERYTGRAIFMHAGPAGVIGPHNPLYFPLALSLHEQPEVDRSRFGAHWQGADYIGAAAINQQQEWTLRGLQANRRYWFEVQASALEGDLQDNDRTFVLQARVQYQHRADPVLTHRFDFSNGQTQRWTIPLLADSDTVKVVLQHDYQGPRYRYMKMQSYSLREAN